MLPNLVVDLVWRFVFLPLVWLELSWFLCQWMWALRIPHLVRKTRVVRMKRGKLCQYDDVFVVGFVNWSQRLCWKRMVVWCYCCKLWLKVWRVNPGLLLIFAGWVSRRKKLAIFCCRMDCQRSFFVIADFKCFKLTGKTFLRIFMVLKICEKKNCCKKKEI